MEKLEIVYLPKDSLRLLDKNPRRLKDTGAIKKLETLIREHGFQNPLQVFEEEGGQYTILCGNHRFVAGQRLGMTEFPCIIYRGDKKRALARAVSDNKSSEWTDWDYPKLVDMFGELKDLDVQLTGFDLSEMELLPKETEITVEGEQEGEEGDYESGKYFAPFPYFGGKTKVAPLVWKCLGDVKHYIEPFFGSGAVLLNRPDYRPNEHVETVCDADAHLANVWRSLQFSPDETARWCDWPVNHADLMARRERLLREEGRLLSGLVKDDKWHDPELGGYWIWAASCWIGGGLTRTGAMPHVGNGGMGIHAISKRPHVSHRGMGIHALGVRSHSGDVGREADKLGKCPRLSDTGTGINKISGRPHVGAAGEGVHKMGLRKSGGAPAEDLQVGDPYNINIYAWFRRLSERLRHVRVVCGDWTRVCGGNWQDNMGIVGIFFDPPYGDKDRAPNLYHKDSIRVAQDVCEWSLGRGDNPNYRIVVAGYEGEHEKLLQAGWSAVKWVASGGYGNQRISGENTNRFRERLFISPHCHRPCL